MLSYLLIQDTRLFLPSRHALTRLIILNEHTLAGHAGPLLYFNANSPAVLGNLWQWKRKILYFRMCRMCSTKG